MEKSTVSINKKTVERIKTIEVKGDVIVPDTKPDIVNIINTNSNSYIYKEDCEEGKYRFDGNVNANIIYLSENGETKSISHPLDFMDFIEDSSIKANMSTKYRIEIVSCESKILNERKVSLVVNLKICFSFFECEDFEYLNDLSSLSGVEKLQETVELNTIVAMNSVKSSLKDDINIQEESISEILKTSVLVSNIENKISYNKVLAKADANIKILYITESAKISSFETTVPIMNFIDMENVTDENQCKTTYKIRNINCKTNSYQIDFEVSCEVYKKQTIEVVQDMYGIDKMVTFNQKSVEVQVDEEIENEKIEVSENVLVEDIKGVYDVEFFANMTNKNEGELVADIYYEAGNNLGVKKAKVPFIVKSDYDMDTAQINIVSKSFKLIGENVAFDVSLEVGSNSNQYKRINLIDEIQEEELQNDDEYAMIVYFVKEGDTIWNIARDFRVTQNSIIKNNNLQEKQNIHIGDRLYIMK